MSETELGGNAVLVAQLTRVVLGGLVARGKREVEATVTVAVFLIAVIS